MGSAISFQDRIWRSLFVAWAVGLGWAIRGDFGHLVGAMFPGAALGLAFAYVSGQRNLFRWAPVLATASGLGIGQGGYMSYGILHGYAQSDTVINYAYGFFTLFLQGGCWGVFGCALVGLLLERERVTAREWLTGLAAVFCVGIIFQAIVVYILGFHINPPRSDASIAFVGGAIGLFVWLVYTKKPYGFKGALFGFIGFGLGMSLGRLLGNIANISQQGGGFTINHWNIMEMTVGLIGGFVFTFGMLGKQAPDRTATPPAPVFSILSATYVTTLILLLHRFLRIEAPKRLTEWTASFTEYKVTNPETYAQYTLWALNILCIAAIILTIVWIFLLFRNKTRFAWFPVLLLSGEMLLFQNIAALYFFYPRVPNQINMHTVFWVLFMLMVCYILFRTFVKPHSDAHNPDDVAEHVNWRAWTAFAIGAYLVIVGLAHFVNGAETMKGANTRFPVWSWSDGPFPGPKNTATAPNSK